MSTLLLRLAGPMQSWGTQSRFRYRDTGLEPSKSGVIGLLCAALGRPREAAVDDLAALRMGVRVDQAGVMQRDFHTVGGQRETAPVPYGVAQFDGSSPATALSYRYYLADADFLVGLEARTPNQENVLRMLDAALARPVWPLYLGRRAFVPGIPIRLPDAPPLGPGLRPEPLREALLSYPWPKAQPSTGRRNGSERLRFVFELTQEEAETEGGETRLDVPVSFAPLDRRYLSRSVAIESLLRPS